MSLRVSLGLEERSAIANAGAAAILGDQRVSYHLNPYEAAEGATALVVLTEWNEFRNVDLKRLKSAMKGNLLVDARNVYDPATAAALGFRYTGVGRSSSLKGEATAVNSAIEQAGQPKMAKPKAHS